MKHAKAQGHHLEKALHHLKVSQHHHEMHLAKEVGKEAKGYGFGETAKEPKGVANADTRGERHEKMREGVAMGKEDGLKNDSLFDGGRQKEGSVQYVHVRAAHAQDE